MLQSAPRTFALQNAASAYRHQPPHKVVSVWIFILGTQLRGIELRGPQDLQDSVQGLSHRHGAALLCCVDDVDDLKGGKINKKKNKFLVDEVKNKVIYKLHNINETCTFNQRRCIWVTEGLWTRTTTAQSPEGSGIKRDKKVTNAAEPRRETA